MGLIESLPEGRVAIDTAILIYLAERHEKYPPIIRPLFEAADGGRLDLVHIGADAAGGPRDPVPGP